MNARRIVISFKSQARLRRISRMSVRWRVTRGLFAPVQDRRSLGPYRGTLRSQSAATRRFWLHLGKRNRLADFRERLGMGWVFP